MKKIAYIFLTAILGLLFSLIIHAIIEIILIALALRQNIILTANLNGSCFLPNWLNFSLTLFGLGLGLGLGFRWWKIVYKK